MIRFPKIFQKNSSSNEESIQIRKSQSNLRNIKDEMSSSEFTEDPESQKARHRLLGAVVLVLVAVIGLPKIFDAQPKKITNDVVLQMVASVVEPTKDIQVNSADKSKENSEIATKNKKEVPAAKSTDKNIANEQINKDSSAKPETKNIEEPITEKKSLDKSLERGEEVIEEVKTKKATSVKYVLNVGAFSTMEKVKKLAARLKEQKISSYSLERKKDDVTLYLLRAGPFIDKAEAESAEKKIKAMGLTPKLVEQPK